MHRTIEISIAAEAADDLVSGLRGIDGVVGLARYRGASLVPPGDIVRTHVLNRAADEVLRAVAATDGRAAVVTAEVASISERSRQEAIDDDVDEAIWEEVETGLRHQGRIGINYLLLMALGGVIGAAGSLADPAIAAAAYVASAIIAPGFEPVAKLPLGLVLRRTQVLKAGLISTLAGYGALAFAAAVTYLVLSWLGLTDADKFLASDALHSTIDPSALVLGIAAAGAFSGVIIQMAYRRSVIAGALVALRLVEIAAVLGVAVAIGRFDLAGQALLRLGIDIGFVLVAGIVVFGLKQAFLHRRTPLH